MDGNSITTGNDGPREPPRLDNIPPELRNTIYELTATNQDEASVDTDLNMVEAPLMRVSRSLRQEFSSYWSRHVLEYTKSVTIRLTDFFYLAAAESDRGGIDLDGAIRSLPPSVPGVTRTIVVRVWLTNALNTDIRTDVRIRDFCLMIDSLRRRSQSTIKVEVFWDPKIFEETYVRGLQERLRFRICGTRVDPSGSPRQEPVLSGRLLRESFQEAFTRYEKLASDEKMAEIEKGLEEQKVKERVLAKSRVEWEKDEEKRAERKKVAQKEAFEARMSQGLKRSSPGQGDDDWQSPRKRLKHWRYRSRTFTQYKRETSRAERLQDSDDDTL